MSQFLFAVFRLLYRIPPSPITTISDGETLETMKAVVLPAHGDASVLIYQDFPKPFPAPGSTQVQVQLCACSVNPVDFKLRQNPIYDAIYPKPRVLGNDFSGVVPATGTLELEVLDSPTLILATTPTITAPLMRTLSTIPPTGQRVFGMLPFFGSVYGSYAEWACPDEDSYCLAPPGVSLEDMAAVPLVGSTVIQALRPVIAAYGGRAGCAGKKCLISQGSGGLGTFAVQYCAHVLKMDVTAMCSPRNFKLLLALGANTVVDYKREVTLTLTLTLT